jgi:putative membrane-bound dehydrogenase-like protein
LLITSCGNLSAVIHAQEHVGIERPRVLDERLAIDLIAAEPELVTPVAIATDPNSSRVYVVESHTHFRPDGYDGPKADRILGYEDADSDGTVERRWVAHEGTVHTMGLGFHPDGRLFVVTRQKVITLSLDPNGVASGQGSSFAHLETEGDYPHNGLSGLAFDFAGNVYIGQGENLGKSAVLVCKDDTRLPFDTGEGGVVYRFGPDGSKAERICGGFWNPFALAFDIYGRLFTVDNDPDSRPPCRLIHVVQGGDYGFEYRNGRRGTHPYHSWNGELPGTLPMVAGTGEAPSGIVSYDHFMIGFPADYQGALVVGSWGDHRLDRFRVKPRGASVEGERTTIVQGGENFRPVGLAVHPDGSIWFTDWVLRDYPIHKKGRLWRVRNKNKLSEGVRKFVELGANRREREDSARRQAGGESEKKLLEQVAVLDVPRARELRASAVAACASTGNSTVVRAILAEGPPELRALVMRTAPEHAIEFLRYAADEEFLEPRSEALRRVRGGPDLARNPTVLEALRSEDPFLAQAAREALRNAKDIVPSLVTLTRSETVEDRIGALLVLRTLHEGDSELPRLLADPDARVRRLAVIWVGEAGRKDLRETLLAGFRSDPTNASLFETYLATLDRLDRGLKPYENEQPAQGIAWGLAIDKNLAPPLRVRALRMVDAANPVVQIDALRKLVAEGGAVAIEALRSLRQRTEPEIAEFLIDTARDPQLAESLRAEAIAGIGASSVEKRALLVQLAGDASSTISRQALRSFRGVPLTGPEREKLAAVEKHRPELADAAALVLAPDRPPARPPQSDTHAWKALLDAAPGDAAEGERLFYHPRGPNCVRCHSVDGRGSLIGPELTALATTMSRERFLESLLDPSREIAPQFTTWVLEMRDGTLAQGSIVSETDSADVVLADTEGKLSRVKVRDVMDRKPDPNSIMPAGLEATLTFQEIRDLAAFLLEPRNPSR